MATQWQAGLTSYSKLPAATLNTIGAAWETWTPTFTPTTGTITTSTLTRARYMRIQKLVIGRFEFVITTAGTAAGAFLDFTPPITASSNIGGQTSMGFGREYLSTGYTLNVINNSATSFRVLNFDNAGVIQNNRGISVNFIYEAA